MYIYNLKDRRIYAANIPSDVLVVVVRTWVDVRRV